MAEKVAGSIAEFGKTSIFVGSKTLINADAEHSEVTYEVFA